MSRRADFGTAGHDVNLTGGASLHEIKALHKDGHVVEDYRTKAAKEERDAALARGKTPVLKKEAATLLSMNEEFCTFVDHLDISLDKVEQTVIWQEGGLWCKARFDILDHKYKRGLDYKTTDNAHPITWSRRVLHPGGYDIQAAWYLRGLKAVTGEDWSFFWLPQEMTEPFACSLVHASVAKIAHATEKIEHAIEIWRKCLSTDTWPRYGYGAYEADVPQFERYDWEERKEMGVG